MGFRLPTRFRIYKWTLIRDCNNQYKHTFNAKDRLQNAVLNMVLLYYFRQAGIQKSHDDLHFAIKWHHGY